MSNLSIYNIDSAIRVLAQEADRLAWKAVGWEQRDHAKSLQQIARDAAVEYAVLSQALPRLRDLKAAADREYDRYVTRPPLDEDGGCSCHISAPCSWCTRETEEEPANA